MLFFPYLSPTSYLNSWYNAPFTYYDATWCNMMQYAIRGKIHNLIFQIRDATGHSSWEKFMISKLCIFRFIHLNYFHSRVILCLLTVQSTSDWIYQLIRSEHRVICSHKIKLSSVWHVHVCTFWKFIWSVPKIIKPWLCVFARS